MQGPLFQSLSIVNIRTTISPSLMSVIDKTRCRDRPSLPADFVNGIFLEHSHVHVFSYCLWLLLLYNTVNSCDKDGVACKPEIFTIWSFVEKVCQLLLHTDEVINGASYNSIHLFTPSINTYWAFTVFQLYVIQYVCKDEHDTKTDPQDHIFHRKIVMKLFNYNLV